MYSRRTSWKEEELKGFSDVLWKVTPIAFSSGFQNIKSVLSQIHEPCDLQSDLCQSPWSFGKTFQPPNSSPRHCTTGSKQPPEDSVSRQQISPVKPLMIWSLWKFTSGRRSLWLLAEFIRERAGLPPCNSQLCCSWVLCSWCAIQASSADN